MEKISQERAQFALYMLADGNDQKYSDLVSVAIVGMTEVMSERDARHFNTWLEVTVITEDVSKVGLHEFHPVLQHTVATKMFDKYTDFINERSKLTKNTLYECINRAVSGEAGGNELSDASSGFMLLTAAVAEANLLISNPDTLHIRNYSMMYKEFWGFEFNQASDYLKLAKAAST